MVSFDVVDLSDDHDLARIHALADVLGMQRDAYPGHVLDAAIRRLRDAWTNDDHEDYLADDEAPSSRPGDDTLRRRYPERYAAAAGPGCDCVDEPDETDTRHCDRCQDPEHDTCSLDPSCPCCADTIARIDEPAPADDETDSRWGRAMDAIADALDMERDNDPVHLLEAAAHRLAPTIEVGSLIQGHVLPDLPDGVRYTEADETGSPVEYGVVLQVRPGYVPGVVEPHRFYVIVSVPGSGS